MKTSISVLIQRPYDIVHFETSNQIKYVNLYSASSIKKILRRANLSRDHFNLIMKNKPINEKPKLYM